MRRFTSFGGNSLERIRSFGGNSRLLIKSFGGNSRALSRSFGGNSRVFSGSLEVVAGTLEEVDGRYFSTLMLADEVEGFGPFRILFAGTSRGFANVLDGFTGLTELGTLRFDGFDGAPFCFCNASRNFELAFEDEVG